MTLNGYKLKCSRILALLRIFYQGCRALTFALARISCFLFATFVFQKLFFYNGSSFIPLFDYRYEENLQGVIFL